MTLKILHWDKHMADVALVNGHLKVTGKNTDDVKEVEDILDSYRKNLRIAPEGQVADRHSPLVSEAELYEYLPIGMRGEWHIEQKGRKNG